MGLLALFTPRPETFWRPPLVVLSGLAVIVAAGDRIEIEHQRLIGSPGSRCWCCRRCWWRWPWSSSRGSRVDLQVGAAGRRDGAVLRRQLRSAAPAGRSTVVAGDQRTAALVALAAPSRPSLFLDATPERSRWVTPPGHRRQGRDRGVADRPTPRAAAARHQASTFPISSPRCRARSSAASRAGCR